MKPIMKVISAIAVALGSVSALTAQEWTAAQKEVWRNVEAYNQAWAKEDLTGFLAYVDDDFLGWDNEGALPRTKEDQRKMCVYFFEANDVVLFDFKPVGIKIDGDIAIVHYCYSLVARGKDSSDTVINGRWTDILKKKGQRWICIADHGGADPGG